MNALFEAIDGREKGAFPISVATSLAIESACGVYPDRPVSPAPILSVKEVWFNVRTLLRNLLGSIAPDFRDHLIPPHLLPALVEEMRIIESAVLKGSNGNCRAVFYHADYTSIARKFPKAIVKIARTARQMQQNLLDDKTLKLLLEEQSSGDIRVFNFEITGNHPESFIVTHLPVDLLSKYSFKRLDLLESHTGAIKAWPQWNTKLTNGRELLNIPFNQFSLQVFGDNGNHFSPQSLSVRREVVRLADEDRWTPVTTDSKIRDSLRKVNDATERTLLLSLL